MNVGIPNVYNRRSTMATSESSTLTRVYNYIHVHNGRKEKEKARMIMTAQLSLEETSCFVLLNVDAFVMDCDIILIGTIM